MPHANSSDNPAATNNPVADESFLFDPEGSLSQESLFDDQTASDSSDANLEYEKAIRQARREARLRESAWRRQRAEVARLVAIGEEAAADRLLGLEPSLSLETHSTSVGNDQAKGDQVQDKLVDRFLTNTKPRSGKQSKANGKEAHPRETPLRETQPKNAQPKKTEPKEDLSVVAEQIAKPQSKQIPSPSHRKVRKSLAKRWGIWISERPPWAISLTLHTALLLLLGILSFATFQEDPFVLTASLDDGKEWADEVPEISLAEWETSDETLDAELPELEPSMVDPVVESLALPVIEIPVLDTVPIGTSLTAEVMSAMSTDGQQSDSSADSGESNGEQGGKKGTKTGGMGKVRFFGVQERADKVVFVVDNSGSMQRGRMETTLDELHRAIQGLASDQSFYVIFYSDQAYPMMYPESVEGYLPATRENKRKLTKWLYTVEICLGGRLLDAMEMASKLEPHVVFLMSDGDIRSQRVMESLTNAQEWPFTIHSFGMGVRSDEHAEKLDAIAAANDGQFRVVEAHPAAIQHARTSPIPYHRKAGEVWGSKVQVW